ncbi:MAG: hypothetical protein QW724_04665 [Nitrososphaerota archaeon]
MKRLEELYQRGKINEEAYLSYTLDSIQVYVVVELLVSILELPEPFLYLFLSPNVS